MYHIFGFCAIVGTAKRAVIFDGPAVSMERAMGIEPTSRAWEARILPMNYARVVRCADIVPIHSRLCRLSYHFCGGLASFSFPGAYRLSETEPSLS